MVNGGLWAKNGCHRLESHPEIDVLAIADATLYATTVVGSDAGTPSGISFEEVVLLASLQVSATEAQPILEAFGGIDAKHGIAQTSMQLSELWFAQTHGKESVCATVFNNKD